jgi:cbb3-type cytochrome oxidase subunit 3
MIDFFAHHAGLIGLLFFFAFFSVTALWVFRPGSKSLYKLSANIPLDGDKE